MIPSILKANMMGAQSRRGEYGAVGWSASPYITFFKKVGTQLIKLTDPGTMPTGPVTAIDWSRFGNFVGIVYDDKMATYKVENDVVTFLFSRDFTTVPDYEDLVSGAWSKERVDPNDDNNWFHELYSSTRDFRNGYRFGGKKPTTSGGTSVGVEIAAAGTPVAAAFLKDYSSSDGGFLIAYGDLGTGYRYLDIQELSGFGSSPISGAIVTQPAVAPVYVASRRDATAFAVALNAASNNLLIYTRSGANWDIANTLTVGGTPTRCDFSDDGNYLVVTHNTSPFYDVIDFTSGSPVVVAASDALPAAGTDVAVSLDGQTFITGSGSSPFLQIQGRGSSGDYVTVVDVDFDGVTESAVTAVALKNNAYVT